MRSRRNASSGLPVARSDEHAEHLRAGVVHPFLTGLVHERQRPERRDPLVGGVRARWPRRTERGELQLGLGALDRIRAGRRHDRAEAEAEREQIIDGDRADRGHGVVELGVEAAQHAPIRQLGRRSSTGSSRRSTPSSTSIIAAAAVIGLVSDAMRKIAACAASARRRRTPWYRSPRRARASPRRPSAMRPGSAPLDVRPPGHRRNSLPADHTRRSPVSETRTDTVTRTSCRGRRGRRMDRQYRISDATSVS